MSQFCDARMNAVTSWSSRWLLFFWRAACNTVWNAAHAAGCDAVCIAVNARTPHRATEAAIRASLDNPGPIPEHRTYPKTPIRPPGHFLRNGREMEGSLWCAEPAHYMRFANNECIHTGNNWHTCSTFVAHCHPSAAVRVAGGRLHGGRPGAAPYVDTP